MSDTLEKELADALRDAQAHIRWCSGSPDFLPGGQARVGWEKQQEIRNEINKVLAEYDAKHKPPPDAPIRIVGRWFGCKGVECSHTGSRFALESICREEYAKDNAQRDARDKEREEAAKHASEVLRLLHGQCNFDAAVCAASAELDRAFGLDKGGVET